MVGRVPPWGAEKLCSRSLLNWECSEGWWEQFQGGAGGATETFQLDGRLLRWIWEEKTWRNKKNHFSFKRCPFTFEFLACSRHPIERDGIKECVVPHMKSVCSLKPSSGSVQMLFLRWCSHDEKHLTLWMELLEWSFLACYCLKWFMILRPWKS